jgi:hypothetical protein
MKTETIIQLGQDMKPQLRLRKGRKEIVLNSDQTTALKNRLLDVSLWEADREPFAPAKPDLAASLEDFEALLKRVIEGAEYEGNPIIHDLMSLKSSLNPIWNKVIQQTQIQQ